MPQQWIYFYVPLFLLGLIQKPVNDPSATETMHAIDRTPTAPRRCSPQRFAKALRALNPLRRSKPCLQKQLDAARRSSPSWNPPRPRKECLALFGDPADGVWAPDCGHENQLIHFEGPRPFKHLKCYCDHLLSSDDLTSEILTPLSSLTMEILKQRFEDQRGLKESRYCQLCQACGLTHRAVVISSRIEFPTMPCICREVTSKEPMYFYIGDVGTYREDPNGVAVNLSLKRRFAASQRCRSSRTPIAQCVLSSADAVGKFRLATKEAIPAPMHNVPQEDISERPKRRAQGH